MNAREIIKLLMADGWKEVRSKGSHRHFQHKTKPGTVTVPVHGARDLKKPTVASIMRQAGLESQEK